MKQLNCNHDHPHKLAPRSNVCSVKHYSSTALPGLIDPGLPIYNMSNICSSTSAESSTVASSPTPPTSAPSQQPIHHNTPRNQAVLKVKLPCSGDRDAISLKFKRSCSDDVGHSCPPQYYSTCDHDHDQYEQTARSFYGISKLQQCSINIREKVGADVVCSMCGDEGIAELLFLCSKCFHRPQHIYCSRSYPDLCDEASICNWCLHEENSSTISVPKESAKELARSETDADTKAGKVERANLNYGCTNVNEKHPIKQGDHNYEAHNLNVDEASLKVEELVSVNIKGHGKAFEYLLMIAAESLPQVMGEAAHAEIKQEIHTTAGTMINISTDAKMGSRQIKELDNGKLDMGTSVLEINNSTANLGGYDQHNMTNANANANDRNGVNLRTLGNGQHTVKMDIVLDQMGTRMGECGAVFGGHIPRRQRCASKAAGMTASLKYRKKGGQLSPSRPNYRRYKLLADVVC